MNIEYWYFILLVIVMTVIFFWRCIRFLKKPTQEQMQSVREWLLYAVTVAEKALGSGTGKLKLRYVYNMFIEKFSYLAKIITFDTFSNLVDMALDDLEEMINNIPAVSEYVTGNTLENKTRSDEYEHNNNSRTQ